MIQARKQQPPGNGVTPRDLVAVQDNFNSALRQLQAGALRPAPRPPASSTSSGERGDFFIDLTGNLYVCFAPNVWRKFVGAVF